MNKRQRKKGDKTIHQWAKLTYKKAIQRLPSHYTGPNIRQMATLITFFTKGLTVSQVIELLTPHGELLPLMEKYRQTVIEMLYMTHNLIPVKNMREEIRRLQGGQSNE